VVVVALGAIRDSATVIVEYEISVGFATGFDERRAADNLLIRREGFGIILARGDLRLHGLGERGSVHHRENQQQGTKAKSEFAHYRPEKDQILGLLPVAAVRRIGAQVYACYCK
jgi:hypothetical protein